MITLKKIAFSAAALAISLGMGLTVASGAQASGKRYYEVTVQNLTYGQPISPPVIVTHKQGFSLFNAGEAASDDLAALAEDADNSGLVSFLESQRRVASVAVGAGPIPPGQAQSTIVETEGNANFISAIGMLVNTNDAFFGVRHFRISRSFRSIRTTRSPAYDAGSEANNEDCGFIPGPACGTPFVRATDGAEGIIHIHRGVHGVGDLEPSIYDWRNPAVQVSIRRVEQP
ncbi:MAG: spondin domain-containing protein [Pseudomonadota bacterium]